jgi:hypothetical protein
MNGEVTSKLTRRHEPRRCRYGRPLISIQKSSNRKALRSGSQRTSAVDIIHDDSRVGALGPTESVERAAPSLAALVPAKIHGCTVQSGPVRHWADVMVTAQASGRRMECADAWIAATALLYDAPLVTHNRGDYLGVPKLTLISHAT